MQKLYIVVYNQHTYLFGMYFNSTQFQFMQYFKFYGLLFEHKFLVVFGYDFIFYVLNFTFLVNDDE